MFHMSSWRPQAHGGTHSHSSHHLISPLRALDVEQMDLSQSHLLGHSDWDRGLLMELGSTWPPGPLGFQWRQGCLCLTTDLHGKPGGECAGCGLRAEVLCEPGGEQHPWSAPFCLLVWLPTPRRWGFSCRWILLPKAGALGPPYPHPLMALQITHLLWL